MVPTILLPEALYPDDAVERAVFGTKAPFLHRDVAALAELDPADCASAVGLMTFRLSVTAEDLARFPRLKALVRMGVGYDQIDRAAAASRGVLVCNVPDYGTEEVADHAMAMVLVLRRGLALHFETQRHQRPSPWAVIEAPFLRRNRGARFGIIGLGRIGTAVALRARAFGFAVGFYDPFLPNGIDRALGIERYASLAELLRVSEIVSLHAPLTQRTRGMFGAAEFALMVRGAVLVNTARGALVDLDALERALRTGKLGAAALDVLPIEPPPELPHPLIAAWRAGEPGLAGRVILTPHAAFHSPESWADIRLKSAQTMHAALFGPAPQNVVLPEAE